MKLLENKVALITGGSRGIGKSIVEKFVLNGCNVAFTYNKSESDAKLIESNLSDIDIKIYDLLGRNIFTHKQNLYKKKI